MAKRKKTFSFDPELLKNAREACGAQTDTETIEEVLWALVRKDAYESLRKFRGSEPDAPDVPRRREEPVKRRRVA
jgi:hypothetical protein